MYLITSLPIVLTLHSTLEYDVCLFFLGILVTLITAITGFVNLVLHINQNVLHRCSL